MSQKETINNKIEKLNQEIEWFYSNEFSLDEAQKRYEESIELTKEIERDLENLKNEITILSEDFS